MTTSGVDGQTAPDRTVTDEEWSAVLGALTRRRFLGAGLSGAALLGLGATGTGEAGAATSPGWTFTDDRGRRVHLATRPTRIACLTDTTTAALWATGLRPVAATDSHQGIDEAVGITFSGVRDLGTGLEGDIDVEALAAARPDLLVDTLQPDGSLQTVSGVHQVADIAPVVALDMYHPVQRIAATAERLTASTGAPVTDRAAKARFGTAMHTLYRAIEANPHLRVAFVFDIGTSEIGVMNPVTWPILQTVQGLGLQLVPVDGGADNLYSRAVSWELAPKVPADLVIWAVSDPLPTNPAWKAMPAVRAGQWWKPDIASWYAYSYGNYASLLSSLAARVRHARPGVGPARWSAR